MTPTVDTLTVDKVVFYNEFIGLLPDMQYMDGVWQQRNADRLFGHAVDQIETYAVEEYTNVTAWTTGTDSTYHDNVAGAALTTAMVRNSIASMTRVKGVRRQNLLWGLTPQGVAEFKEKLGSTWQYQTQNPAQATSALGVPVIGFVDGIPAVELTCGLESKTAAATASAISSNVLTITVPAEHGFVAGQRITTSGGTANVTSATAITSTTATTIVVALTACDDASNGAMTVTAADAENLLVDTANVFGALQKTPTIRVVPDPESAGDALQLVAPCGFIGHAGRVRVLHVAMP